MKKIMIFLCLSFVYLSVYANDSLAIDQELSEEQMMELWSNYLDSIENTLQYETGVITLNNMATIEVPSGFKFLNAEDSDMIITDLWGNPPSEDPYKSWGMLIPVNDTPLSDSSYCINITYMNDGYVKDDDAADIDYDELMETMIEDTEAENEYRIESGYMPIKLIGWASQPYYDSAEKKLHWAKELDFGDSENRVLNYSIRILGRKGILELNAISEMYMLGKVQNEIPSILESIDFVEGSRYDDFDSNLDKVAAYGIGGLIAGKILAKVGILAKFGIVLAKFWKLIAVGVVALFAGFKRFFMGKKETVEQGELVANDEEE